jgi:hypothetical protein
MLFKRRMAYPAQDLDHLAFGNLPDGENDWKCERIFEDAAMARSTSLMNFSPKPGWRWLYY